MEAGEDIQELTAEILAQAQRKERKELQGALDCDSRPSVSTREFLRRLRNAQAVPFDIARAATPSVRTFLSMYASALDCRESTVFFPLLSACAACMGSQSYMQLTSQWQEQPILWTLCVVDECFSSPPLLLVEYLRTQLVQVQQHHDTPQFVLDDFDQEGLHRVLVGNGGHGIALYDDVRTLRRIFSERFVPDLLTKLHSGHSWMVNRASSSQQSYYQGCIPKTSLSVAAQCSSDSLHSHLFGSNPFSAILKDLFLCICSDKPLSQLSFSILEVFEAKKLFKVIYDLHRSNRFIYRFDSEAFQKFKTFCNDAENSGAPCHAARHLARISCILHVFENAVESLNWNMAPDPATWNTVVTDSTLWRAQLVLHFAHQQKKALHQGTVTSFRPTAPSGPRVDVVSSSQEELTVGSSSKKRKNNATDHPTIVSVMSAGIPVNPSEEVQSLSSSAPFIPLPPELTLSHSLSVSLVQQPSDLLSGEQGEQFNSLTQSSDEFLKEHLLKIKRFLVHKDPCMTPARAVQLKLFRNAPHLDPRQPKYTCNFARQILRYIADLGFGEVRTVGGGTTRGFVFKKKLFELLGVKQKEMLKYMGVSSSEYNRFAGVVSSTPQRQLSKSPDDIVEIAD